MFRLLSSLFLITTFYIQANNVNSTSVTVTVPTANLNDTKAIAAAKNKAVLEAMDNLPSVVWGTENLNNDQYSENIRSIGFAYAQVTLTKEIFDRKANTLTIDADVSWDEEKIRHTLGEVSEGEQAKKVLSQIAKLTRSASLQEYIKVAGVNRLTPLEEATLLVNPHFFATSFSELQRLFMQTVYQIAKPMTDNLLSIADAIKMQFVRADNQYLYFTVNKPPSSQTIEFTSPELAKFYKQNKVLIDDVLGELCFFNSDHQAIFSWKGFSTTSAQELAFKIDTKQVKEQGLVERYFQRELYPLEILICSNSSIKHSVDISYLNR
jgi:hypothetical protein